MLKAIARRLVTSLGPVPHFFLTTEIEMDRAAEMRRAINELDPDLKISVNDVIIKVAATALMQHPQVNASFQEQSIRYYERADLGVAVAIEEGLITPVVRSADQKSLSEIATEVGDLAARARARKLKPIGGDCACLDRVERWGKVARTACEAWQAPSHATKKLSRNLDVTQADDVSVGCLRDG